MADISYGSPYPFVDGTSTVTFNSLFYDTTPANSLVVVNGNLDEANCHASEFQVEREHVQRGSGVKVWQTSGTATLDYFDDLFALYDTSSFTASLRDVEQVIPGAALRFYLPWDAVVWTMHGMMMANTSNSDSDSSRMFMRVDGVWENNMLRGVGDSMYGTGNVLHAGYYKNRYWSGSNRIDLSPGWHDISMYMVADKDVPQTRVWARRLIVVALRDVS